MKRLIYFLLTLLGFGAVSCEESGLGGGGNLDAYGTPYVSYRITARVVNSEGVPIQGIEATGTDYETNSITVHSDEQGLISFTQRSFELPEGLRIYDVDGEENGGEFKEKIVNVEFKKVEDGESWNRGHYEADLGDVTLEHIEK